MRSTSEPKVIGRLRRYAASAHLSERSAASSHARATQRSRAPAQTQPQPQPQPQRLEATRAPTAPAYGSRQLPNPCSHISLRSNLSKDQQNLPLSHPLHTLQQLRVIFICKMLPQHLDPSQMQITSSKPLQNKRKPPPDLSNLHPQIGTNILSASATKPITSKAFAPANPNTEQSIYRSNNTYNESRSSNALSAAVELSQAQARSERREAPPTTEVSGAATLCVRQTLHGRRNANKHGTPREPTTQQASATGINARQRSASFQPLTTSPEPESKSPAGPPP